MRRIAFAALALLLASHVSAHAQTVRQESAPARAGALTSRDPPALQGRAGDATPTLPPSAVICIFDAGTDNKPREQRIQLAPGQNPLTVCPASARPHVFDYDAKTLLAAARKGRVHIYLSTGLPPPLLPPLPQPAPPLQAGNDTQGNVMENHLADKSHTSDKNHPSKQNPRNPANLPAAEPP